MKWEQYSKRRSTSLQDFLTGCDTLEAAILIFEKRGIEPPLDLLSSHYQKLQPIVETVRPAEMQTVNELVQSTNTSTTFTSKKSKANSGTSTN